MKIKKGKMFSEVLKEAAEGRGETSTPPELLDIGRTVRSLREAKGMTGARLCRAAKDLDPRTLTAVEKGRIRNPSVKTLSSVARGLGMSVSELFRRAEARLERNLSFGNQKGTFSIDFPAKGVKITAFTPLVRDFFCGKMILAPRTRIDESILKHKAYWFVSGLLGRIEVTVEGEHFSITEGQNLFFNGFLRHSFYNPLHRESAILTVTAPLFF